MLFAVILSAIYYGAAVDQTPLGPTFNLLLLGSTIAGTATAALLILFFSSRTTSQNADVEKPSQTRRWREIPLRNYIYLAGTLLVLAAILVAVLLVWDGARDSKTLEKAYAAEMEFQIEHQGAGFEQGQVNQTLAELMEAYELLSVELPLPSVKSQITIKIYRDLTEYRTGIGMDRSFGAVQCTPNGAIIYIPLEEELNLFTENDESRTPMHEMVHAVMCQALGREKMYSIPSWFHEGMAQIYENDGPSKYARILNRSFIWFMQSKIMPNTTAAD